MGANEPKAPRQSAAEAAGFWKSDSALASPDLNLVHIEIPHASAAGMAFPAAAGLGLVAGDPGDSVSTVSTDMIHGELPQATVLTDTGWPLRRCSTRTAPRWVTTRSSRR